MQLDLLTITFADSIVDIGADVLHLAGLRLALPIGWDRERETHRAGIRTFPIVAIASCGLAIMGAEIKGASPESYSRILQGLVTGIGFIGGGAILKDKGSVSGTATAASIWSIGIVGAAVGFHLYHVAIALTLVNFLTLRMMQPWRSSLANDDRAKNGTSGPAV